MAGRGNPLVGLLQDKEKENSLLQLLRDLGNNSTGSDTITLKSNDDEGGIDVTQKSTIKTGPSGTTAIQAAAPAMYAPTTYSANVATGEVGLPTQGDGGTTMVTVAYGSEDDNQIANSGDAVSETINDDGTVTYELHNQGTSPQITSEAVPNETEVVPPVNTPVEGPAAYWANQDPEEFVDTPQPIIAGDAFVSTSPDAGSYTDTSSPVYAQNSQYADQIRAMYAGTPMEAQMNQMLDSIHGSFDNPELQKDLGAFLMAKQSGMGDEAAFDAAFGFDVEDEQLAQEQEAAAIAATLPGQDEWVRLSDTTLFNKRTGETKYGDGSGQGGYNSNYSWGNGNGNGQSANWSPYAGSTGALNNGSNTSSSANGVINENTTNNDNQLVAPSGVKYNRDGTIEYASPAFEKQDIQLGKNLASQVDGLAVAEASISSYDKWIKRFSDEVDRGDGSQTPGTGWLAPLAGSIYETDLQQEFNAEIRDMVYATLRAKLGAQFTEKEAENLLKTYPNLGMDEAVVLGQLRKRKIEAQQVVADIHSKQAYQVKYGTLLGWKSTQINAGGGQSVASGGAGGGGGSSSSSWGTYD